MSINENDPKMVLAAQAQPSADILRRIAELEEENRALKMANVIEGKFAGEAPKYKLNEPCFLADTYIPKESTIEWFGPPNLEMVPLNEPAKRAMEEHIEQLTNGARQKAELAGRQFNGLINDKGIMIAQAQIDMRNAVAEANRVIALPTDRGEVPLMPHTPQAQAIAKRKPGRPKKLGTVTAPPQKVKRMGENPGEMASPYFVPETASAG